jgi:hypothetical protein
VATPAEVLSFCGRSESTLNPLEPELFQALDYLKKFVASRDDIDILPTRGSLQLPGLMTCKLRVRSWHVDPILLPDWLLRFRADCL